VEVIQFISRKNTLNKLGVLKEDWLNKEKNQKSNKMEVTITEELAKEMYNTSVKSLMDLAIYACPDLFHKEKR